jgi:Protein of unknown function (DUF3089)
MLFCACRPSYLSQLSGSTKVFTIADSIPDYSDLRFWAAHPNKKDPSDSVPQPLHNQPKDSSVDVFFIHPTTLTSKKTAGKIWNASFTNDTLNVKTDYTSILYQASIFNASCRVFAPRYRQAHIYSFYSIEQPQSKAALELAYDDVKKAFQYYLAHHHNDRPIIIASHSQGTYHAGRLLKEFFENKELSDKLVCAYIIGLGVPLNYFTVLEPCNSPDQTKCFVTWRTFREGYLPSYVKNEDTETWCVNPLSWSLSDSAVSRTENIGAVLFKFNKPYKRTNGAKIHKGVLWTNRPRFIYGLFLRTKNYHAGDLNLFYYSIRKNVKDRIESYEKNKSLKATEEP